jgi:hypothetical protein
MKEIIFQKEIPNDLGGHTGFYDHEALIVGVHKKCTFNNVEVAGLVEIVQPDEDDLEGFRSSQDFRDCSGESILTTSEGARQLAKLLNQAADAAQAAAEDFAKNVRQVATNAKLFVLKGCVEQIMRGLEQGETADSILSELKNRYAASFAFAHGAYRLRLFGITTTRTASKEALLKGWCEAATRKIEAA